MEELHGSKLFHEMYLFDFNEYLILTNLCIAGIERKILKNAVDILLMRESIISYLLSRKASVNSRDDFGCTPLHYAVSKCNENAVIQLLEDKNIDLEVCAGMRFQCLNLIFEQEYDIDYFSAYMLWIKFFILSIATAIEKSPKWMAIKLTFNIC